VIGSLLESVSRLLGKVVATLLRRKNRHFW
jgi:hypothetical protein